MMCSEMLINDKTMTLTGDMEIIRFNPIEILILIINGIRIQDSREVSITPNGNSHLIWMEKQLKIFSSRCLRKWKKLKRRVSSIVSVGGSEMDLLPLTQWHRKSERK